MYFKIFLISLVFSNTAFGSLKFQKNWGCLINAEVISFKIKEVEEHNEKHLKLVKEGRAKYRQNSKYNPNNPHDIIPFYETLQL